jgi:hypothetical protein
MSAPLLLEDGQLVHLQLPLVHLQLRLLLEDRLLLVAGGNPGNLAGRMVVELVSEHEHSKARRRRAGVVLSAKRQNKDLKNAQYRPRPTPGGLMVLQVLSLVNVVLC